MNWSLYAMEKIIKRENDNQGSTKKLREQLLALQMNSVRCDDAEKKLALAQQVKELRSQLEACCDAGSITRFEERIASRCLMVLSSSRHLDNGSMRILSVDGIGLASIFLDMPIETDLLVAAIGTISNTISTIGTGAIAPHEIYDPMHLVTSLVEGINGLVASHDLSKNGVIFFTVGTRLYHNKVWRPFFDKLPEHYQNFASMTLGRFPVSQAPTEHETREEWEDDLNHDISSSCLEFTGKLKNCHECGKLKGKWRLQALQQMQTR